MSSFWLLALVNPLIAVEVGLRPWPFAIGIVITQLGPALSGLVIL